MKKHSYNILPIQSSAPLTHCDRSRWQCFFRFRLNIKIKNNSGRKKKKMLKYISAKTATVLVFSRPWPVFRARHGSRIVGMSHTLRIEMKLTAGESKRLRIWPSSTVLDRFPGCGGGFSSILDVPRNAKLKGS